MAFKSLASDSTCIVLECTLLAFLAALSPHRVWWSITLSSELGVLSQHLKHPWSENWPTRTKASYYLNTISSYLLSFIRTRQVLSGTWCCFVLLFSYLVVCLFQAGCNPYQDSQSKSERNKQIQLNFAQHSQLILKSVMFLGRWRERETQIFNSFLLLRTLHEFP